MSLDSYANIAARSILYETNLPNMGGGTSPTDYAQSNSMDKTLFYRKKTPCMAKIYFSI